MAGLDFFCLRELGKVLLGVRRYVATVSIGAPAFNGVEKLPRFVIVNHGNPRVHLEGIAPVSLFNVSEADVEVCFKGDIIPLGHVC